MAAALVACGVVAVVACGGAGRTGREPAARGEQKPAIEPDHGAAPPRAVRLHCATFEEGAGEWFLNGEGYELSVATGQAHRGQKSLRVVRTGGESRGRQFAAAGTSLPAEKARGKWIRLRGQVKAEGIETGAATLWVRIDALGGSRSLALKHSEPTTGTTPWTQREVVLEVPKNAARIFFGAVHSGNGTAWFDTVVLEMTDEPFGTAAPKVAITGVARDAAGKPVEGALVAIVKASSDGASAFAQTAADGGFSASVPEGRYCVTATAPGRAAAYVDVAEFSVGHASKPVSLDFAENGLTISGRVTDLASRPLAGVRLQVIRLSRFECDIFYTDAGADGRYAVTLSKGFTYSLGLESDDFFAESRSTKGESDQTLDLQALRADSLEKPAPEPVVAWLRERAVPLASATAGSGFEDMMPVAAIVGNARVVALGEATHGTREFFQLKHRFLEFLVEKMGFTVFAIEANFTEALAVNQYVLTGKGDPAKALAGMYFWTWDTEEVLEMIEWMRRYNADRRHKKKVAFYGFDMQFPHVAATEVLGYLEKVDRANASQLGTLLAPIQKEDAKVAFDALSLEKRQELRDAVAAAIARLDENQRRFRARSSKREWLLARQNLVVVGQALEMFDAGSVGGYLVRDRAMADNVKWMLDTLARGERVVLWAHNGHISRAGYSGVESMGTHLAGALGSDYLPIGFAFNRGSFQAWDGMPGGGKSRGLMAHRVGPAPAPYVGATLARTGHARLVLDLRAQDAPPEEREWLFSTHVMREIGAVFFDESRMSKTLVLPAHYDALIFVDETTAARPNPSGRRPPK